MSTPEIKNAFDKEYRNQVVTEISRRLSSREDVTDENAVSIGTSIQQTLFQDHDALNEIYTNSLFAVGAQFNITAGDLFLQISNPNGAPSNSNGAPSNSNEAP